MSRCGRRPDALTLLLTECSLARVGCRVAAGQEPLVGTTWNDPRRRADTSTHDTGRDMRLAMTGLLGGAILTGVEENEERLV